MPAFAAENAASPSEAEATRLALPDEDPAGGAPGSDGLDDLFVELIEE